MTISPETLAWLRQCAALDGAAYPQVLLHLLDRVKALEQESTCKEFLQVLPTPEAAPVATDEKLLEVWALPYRTFEKRRACYDLGRQHGAAAAQPAPPPAPAGGLVERVAKLIASFASEGLPGDSALPTARLAIREVAAWLDSNEGLPDLATSRNADGWEMAARILNQEAGHA
jgi:hypothetical protein